jgi:hypothetical protein
MRRTTWIFYPVVLLGLCVGFAPLRTWPQQAAVQPGASASAVTNPELPDAPGEPVQSAGQRSANESQPSAKAGAEKTLPADGADVSGTVTDANGDVSPGATVSIEGDKTPIHQTQTANDNGFFEFKNVAAGDLYRVSVQAEGFESWVSDPVTVASGQFFDVTGIKLKLKGEATSITVVANREEINTELAAEQVRIAEEQRVLGFIPNFYVVYDSKNAVPLTTKLKFQMATRVAVDPVSIFGGLTLAAINQAGNTPDYQQGWKGYGQRFGAVYADGVTDIMFGGAILPSIFHQDPRYFYQGTGTVKSRLGHALANPFVARGDNGRRQINISSMGGDLISAALSNTYYPSSNRGPGLVFGGFALSTGEREVSSVVQEFVLRKLTPAAKRPK